MPSNVTIDFEKARFKFQQANSSQAKLEALAEMQRFAPAHKGGENLRADISKKIAAIKRDIEKQRVQAKKRGGGSGLSVKKEGIGQIVLLGLPNAGKSTLLKKLTGIEVEIAPYPFTTKKPQIGMMNYREAKIQLVEMPAIVEGSSKGTAQGTKILSVARTADGIVLLAKNREEEKLLKKELANAKIFSEGEKPRLDIRQSQFKGITLSGKNFLKCKQEELENFLKSMGLFNVEVILSGPVDLKDVPKALDESIVYKKILVVNGFETLELEKLKDEIFGLLKKILVYTKKPGQKADLKEPLALKKGATIGDVARQLHKELATNLKYARVWGSTKFPGQKVQKEFKLQDRDIVEIYI